MRRYLVNRKLLAGLGLAVALLTVGLWPKAVPVDVAAVSRGPLRVTVEHEGKTRIRQRYAVSAPVTGRLLRIELEPGDEVRKRETRLATFKPGDPGLLDARSRAEAEARVAAAQAAVGRARAAAIGLGATAQHARAEAERRRELARQDVASPEALEAAEASARAAEEALRAAEFQVRGAEHELELARAQLVQHRRADGARELEIRSPIDGVVLTRAQQSEAVLPAGKTLLELGDPRDLEIVADFLSSDAVKVRAGDAALIEQWGGDAPLNGRVRRVEPSGFMKVSALGVEEQRVNVILDFVDPREAWRRLGDGYRVEVRIVVWQQAEAIKLPTSALFRQAGVWAAFVVERGRARLRRLEIGRFNGEEAQVLAGVQAGELVVIHPGDALADGARMSLNSGR